MQFSLTKQGGPHPTTIKSICPQVKFIWYTKVNSKLYGRESKERNPVQVVFPCVGVFPPIKDSRVFTPDRS